MKNTNRPLYRKTLLAARIARLAAGMGILAALSLPAVFAQDSSGNALLSGAFRYRYVGAVNFSSDGAVIETTSSNGVITFNGNGTYTISPGSQWNDNTVSSGASQNIPTGSTGSYAISPAGIGSISNPNPNPNIAGDVLNGTYSQGVFTASSTEDGLSDLFVAIQVGAIPTNATFNSPYWIGALDFAAGEDVDLKNAMFEIAPNGAGSLGALTIAGYANTNSGVALTQNVSGATYNFGTASDPSNAFFNIPAPSGVTASQVLVSGTRNMYVSNDGNFMLGWTLNGYDILFGVKALPASVPGADPLYYGVYYLGGVGDVPTVSGTAYCGPFSFWGSENADGNEDEIVHERFLNGGGGCTNYVDENGYPLPYDFGQWNETALNSDGSAGDAPLDLEYYYDGSVYGFGDSGGNCVPSTVRANTACAFVAISNSPGTFGLTIGVHAPNFTGSGIFLNPIGVVNAASWQPITASVAPGELITLFGSFGNVPTMVTSGGQPFPTVLGTIQVFINGQNAPIYYVSSSQIAVIAPYELATVTPYDECAATTCPITVEVQVNNNNQLSNETSILLLSDANSGIYASNVLGYGPAVALHADYTLVCDPTVDSSCTGSVAQPNETILLALAGMGTVTPPVGDGQVPSTTALSYVDDYNSCGTPPCDLTVYFQDFDNGVYYQNATIPFAGAYPGLASLYQMNVTIPTTVGPGDDVYMEVITPFSDVVQVSIPVGGTANTAAARAASSLHPRQVVGQPLVPVPGSLKHKAAKFTGTKSPPQTAPFRRKVLGPAAAPANFAAPANAVAPVK
jgi:uncharacterized protein (TIGR03437 family)